MKRLFYVLFALSFLIRCTYSSPEDLIEYENMLDYFGQSYCKHFPVSKENFLVGSHQIIDTFAYHNTESFFFQLNTKESEREISRMEEEYKLNRKYNVNDSIFITINDFISIKTLGDKLDVQKSSYYKMFEKDLIPLPNFWNLRYKNTHAVCKLPDDFEIIPLNTQTGMFSKKIDASKSSMPPSLFHGRSKGIAYSKKEKTVIYWVIFW